MTDVTHYDKILVGEYLLMREQSIFEFTNASGDAPERRVNFFSDALQFPTDRKAVDANCLYCQKSQLLI